MEPRVSKASGWKMWEVGRGEYFKDFLVAACSLLLLGLLFIDNDNHDHLYRHHWTCCSATAWNVAVLSPLLGVTWLFGVLSVSRQLIVFQYIFAITNTFQVYTPLLYGHCTAPSSTAAEDKSKMLQIETVTVKKCMKK